MSADEVADAIAYLASPAAGSTTGTCLAVDGGMAGLRLRAEELTAENHVPGQRCPGAGTALTVTGTRSLLAHRPAPAAGRSQAQD